MTVKTNKVQVGQNADPLKNFTLMVPDAPDGSMEIRRGNADAPGALLAKINVDGGVNTNAPAFRMLQSAAQTIADNVVTKISFGVKEIDTLGNAVDTVNSRFKPSVAGYYQLNGSAVYYITGSPYPSQVLIYKNGVVAQAGTAHASPSGIAGFAAVSALIYLNGTTDYVELMGWHNSGGNNSTNHASHFTSFSGFLVKAA